MADEDEMLVALIDRELDEDRSRGLLARLDTDAALRARYEALRHAKAPIGAAFEALLERAPLSGLRTAIPPEAGAGSTRRRSALFGFRELAASFVVGLIVAAAAAWFAVGFRSGEAESDWRAAVVAYMKLYTDETFAFVSPDRRTAAAELTAVGRRVGADLTPENVALPGLDFKVAFILSYDDDPLAELAYVDTSGSPVLFCIIANKGADATAQVETREALSFVTWSNHGRGYLVIGGQPQQRVAEFARKLETSF
jgi:anti-sigma factor RsiW